jgi:hypothetical protein
MRRPFFLIAVALMVLGASVAMADEAILIDFAQLGVDFIENPMKEGELTQNRATMMDFSIVADSSYTDVQKAQMATSLAIQNWAVTLASSARTNQNQSLSFTREVMVAENAKQYPGATVLGLRVRFPLEPVNSWARVSPPFDIPAFEAKADIDVQDGKVVITPKTDEQNTDAVNARLSRFEGSHDPETRVTTAFGVVKNVGVIKSVAVNVRGLNFPHGLSVVLKDDSGNERSMFMGYLNFEGWRELRWDNPQYISEVRNRELRISPLYPKASPYVKFAGFIIHRDASSVGGDFIGYFKDVRVLYDRAVLDPIRDIDDEAIWGIVGKRETDRQKLESQRLGADQVLRYIEREKQETRDEFTK